jgi:hypothetical protein
MASVLLAWELGGGLGHAVPLAALARHLAARGHTVHLAWKDTGLVATAFRGAPPAGVLPWQAPLAMRGSAEAHEPASHAEILLRAGFEDADRLRGRVLAWRSLVTHCAPSLLVADHAPTALLAARGLGLGLRRALIGTGFSIPTDRCPQPSFRDWEAVAPQRLAEAEDRALNACRQVSAALGESPLPHLAALFDADERFLLGWPELDHLAPWRDQALRGWGAWAVGTAGIPPTWPGDASVTGPRLFAYLDRAHPAFAAILAELARGPWRTLAHVDALTYEEARRWRSPWFEPSPRLLDLEAVLAETDAVLCHGNAGTSHAALARGVPLVMLPLQAEHLLLARRVAALGAGVYAWPEEVPSSLRPALQAVLGGPGFRGAARRLAERHAGDGDAIAAIAQRCEALAASGG